MDDQTIKLGFQVDTTQVSAASKAAASVKSAIDDVDAANDKASQRAAARAQKDADQAAKEAKRKADAEVKEAERRAAQIEAIESKFAAAEYRRQVKREQDAERAATKKIEQDQREIDSANRKAAAEMAAAGKVQAAIGSQIIVVDQAATRGTAAARQLGRGGNAGLALLEFSRLTEDAQYGLAGVLNNIPSLVMMLGGTGGIAGAVSLVAVGANLLYKNWDKIESLWKEDTIETQAQRMERLAASTHKTAEETKELTKWQEQQANLAKLLAMPSDEQKKQGSVAESAVNAVGGSHAYEVTLKAAQEADERRTGIPTKNLPAEFQERQRTATSELLAEAMKGNQRALDMLRDVLEKSSLRNDRFALSLGPQGFTPAATPGKDTAEESEFRAVEKARIDNEEADMLNKLGELYESETDVAEARRLNAEKEKAKQDAENAAKAAQQEQDQKGERAAGAYAPLFADALAERMNKGAVNGEDAKALDESLTKQVESRLKRDGNVPEAQRAAAARQIVAQTRQQYDDFSTQSDANRMAMAYSQRAAKARPKRTFSQIMGRRPILSSAAKRRQIMRGSGRLTAKSGGVAGPDGETITPRAQTRAIPADEMFKVTPGMFKDVPKINMKSLDEMGAAANDKATTSLESIDKKFDRLIGLNEDIARGSGPRLG